MKAWLHWLQKWPWFFLQTCYMAKNSCQKNPKFSEILVTKVVQFWCYTKLVRPKKVPLNWYSSLKFFFERLGWFLTLKIDLENQILALFGGYFWPFNKSHEKTRFIFEISAIISSMTWWKTYWSDIFFTFLGPTGLLNTKVL